MYIKHQHQHAHITTLNDMFLFDNMLANPSQRRAIHVVAKGIKEELRACVASGGAPLCVRIRKYAGKHVRVRKHVRVETGIRGILTYLFIGFIKREHTNSNIDINIKLEIYIYVFLYIYICIYSYIYSRVQYVYIASASACPYHHVE